MNRLRREDGFSLVELLVVVLIIAILAAIAIPLFLRQRNKAYMADLQSTLRNAATIAEGIASLNNGSYASLTPASLTAEGLRKASTQTVEVPLATVTAYCIQVTDTRLAAEPWSLGNFSSADGTPEPGTC